MRYLVMTECEVPMGHRQEFVAAVQRWERDAADTAGAPEVHAVYLDAADPAKVMVVTQFASQAAAEQFQASGLMDDFRRELLKCTAEEPRVTAYDLFYSTGPAASRVVFGEDA